MASDAGIYGGHEIGSIRYVMVQVGITDATKEDLDLYIVLGRVRRVIVADASGEVH